MKGFKPGEKPHELDNLADDILRRLEFFPVEDKGMDLTAYRTLCEQRQESYFLFFNSYSYLLHPNWHEAFRRGLEETDGRGLVGATGSYETGKIVDHQFPNPHIRTNGFLVGREDFLEAAAAPLNNKRDCLALESGKNSLTQYFMKRGKQVVVVNAEGDIFDIDDWPSSETFRLGDQQKLLVADNRSLKYHTAFNRRRCHHAQMSWGSIADPQPVSLGTTISRIVWSRICGNGHRIPLIKLAIESRILK
nr:hypothetical protein [uncultured Cohaesibacter sp.]